MVTTSSRTQHSRRVRGRLAPAVITEAVQAAGGPARKQRCSGALGPQPPAVAPPKKKEFEAFGPYKPIAAGARSGLTERQHRALQDFTRRYTAKTPGSKRMTDETRDRFADPRVAGVDPERGRDRRGAREEVARREERDAAWKMPSSGGQLNG